MNTDQKTKESETKKKPLKRHPALVPLSKDHHFGLLLCWKIRTGLGKDIAPERISAYVQYFFDDHLLQHFSEEENYVFSLLHAHDEKRKKAEKQHQTLNLLRERLETEPWQLRSLLQLIEKELETHIRFEERELFTYMQEKLSDEQLVILEQQLEEIHDPVTEQWDDEFWTKQS